MEDQDRPLIVADSILTADGREVVTDRNGANNLPASSGEIKSPTAGRSR